MSAKGREARMLQKFSCISDDLRDSVFLPYQRRQLLNRSIMLLNMSFELRLRTYDVDNYWQNPVYCISSYAFKRLLTWDTKTSYVTFLSG